MRTLKIVLLLTACMTMLQGCFLTKIVTVPMRVVGAAISIIPVAGNTVHDAIDTGADAVDELPF